ncbi:tRNA (N6-adenosine(37)-N6)-threonylcarbamoyltransferase complex ATPase TsaE [Ammoniphilus oxalaticus]|uniref:tRNA threonylcarbamoyladenosine biosynthesis protein TsaE n=1 Tax=Ammoniphilus oxalaticus TaxID=66863 RepID=A0A419SFN8_9BACL|nr:tRNA (adenosine(37)-N6)-threonylcarbamoyltransferase complex ATPase subunit type 1 TsaE [Ammoniphilus oxalaticus]RKD22600.1 tRNA (N6-adenosine(37)-N6)-threonylcarbamoyltransferase complex ATPase TsaE [Ammoniphilus oxalaticus]
MKREYKVTTRSAEETKQWARRLAERVQARDVITLEGDLGAGKTTFTQGFAKGLGVSGVVNSPTFTIVKEYAGRMPLYHMDVYRIEDEFEELGFEEYFYGEGVTVVEWASRIQAALPEQRLEIELKRLTGDEREIIIYPHGERFEQLRKELLE